MFELFDNIFKDYNLFINKILEIPVNVKYH